MTIKKRLICAVTAIMTFFTGTAIAQNMQQAGNTECGILYADMDSVKIVKKDGKFYLMVFGEERYTDKQFLKKLHEGDGMGKVVSAIYLYLFNNNGTAYCIAANYLVDSEGKVCLDLGNDLVMKTIRKEDKALLNVYTMSLKSLELKNH